MFLIFQRLFIAVIRQGSLTGPGAPSDHLPESVQTGTSSEWLEAALELVQT